MSVTTPHRFRTSRRARPADGPPPGTPHPATFLSDPAADVGAPEPLLTAKHLARIIPRSPGCLRDWARDGRIPCVRVGRSLFFRLSEVEACLLEPCRHGEPTRSGAGAVDIQNIPNSICQKE